MNATAPRGAMTMTPRLTAPGTSFARRRRGPGEHVDADGTRWLEAQARQRLRPPTLPTMLRDIATAGRLDAMYCPKCGLHLEQKNGTWQCASGGFELSISLANRLARRFGADFRSDEKPNLR